MDRKKLPKPGAAPEVKFPDFQRATLSNGLKMILAERHSIPVVQLQSAVDAGYAADQFATPGTAKLAMAMLDEGTKKRSSLQISEELALLGANLAAVPTWTCPQFLYRIESESGCVFGHFCRRYHESFISG